MGNPVVVVGAGLAGLTAARRVQQQGRGVVVLEAAPRIGGRLLRQEVAGMSVDGGGAWVGPTQRSVLALVEELGLHTIPTYATGRNLIRLDGRVRARAGSIPPLPLLGLLDLALAQARLDRLSRRLPLRSAELDGMTVGAWMRRNVRTAAAATVLEIAVGATTGADVDDLSLLAFVSHVRSAGGLEQLTGVRGAAQDSRIAGGAVSLCERLANALPPGTVRLDSPVAAVGQGGVRLANGVEVAASDVVVALDPGCCSTIDFGRGLPAGRRVLHERWTMGTGLKLHLAYERPFWRDAGLSGQYMADAGFVRLTFDATPDADGRGVLVAFLGDPLSDPGGNLLEPGAVSQRAARVAQELAIVFGPQAGRPLDVVEQDWRAEPFLDGCVPALAPGVLTAADSNPHASWGRVHFAGAESAERWEGHMDGAVASGEAAAAVIASR